MSKVKALFHIVINTKFRQMTISDTHREDLYRFITKVIKDNGCTLYWINGIPNHVHLLIDLHPSVCLSDLLKEIKRSSSIWMKQSGKFTDFVGWGKEYGAFSLSESHFDPVIKYIKSQQTHHQHITFEDEYQRLVMKNGMEWNEDMLT